MYNGDDIADDNYEVWLGGYLATYIYPFIWIWIFFDLQSLLICVGWLFLDLRRHLPKKYILEYHSKGTQKEIYYTSVDYYPRENISHLPTAAVVVTVVCQWCIAFSNNGHENDWQYLHNGSIEVHMTFFFRNCLNFLLREEFISCVKSTFVTPRKSDGRLHIC